MKTFVVVLAILTGSLQTVTYTNCCQGTLCSQKDNCPTCPESRDSHADDCCGKGAAPRTSDPGCVHLEPSFEVDSGIIPQYDFHAAAWIELVACEPLFASSVDDHGREAVDAPDPASHGETPPLYLRHHAFII